jgi:hypothetical protein
MLIAKRKDNERKRTGSSQGHTIDGARLPSIQWECESIQWEYTVRVFSESIQWEYSWEYLVRVFSESVRVFSKVFLARNESWRADKWWSRKLFTHQVLRLAVKLWCCFIFFLIALKLNCPLRCWCYVVKIVVGSTTHSPASTHIQQSAPGPTLMPSLITTSSNKILKHIPCLNGLANSAFQ